MSEIEVSQHQRVTILTMQRPDRGNRIAQNIAVELILVFLITRFAPQKQSFHNRSVCVSPA